MADTEESKKLVEAEAPQQAVDKPLIGTVRRTERNGVPSLEIASNFNQSLVSDIKTRTKGRVWDWHHTSGSEDSKQTLPDGSQGHWAGTWVIPETAENVKAVKAMAADYGLQFDAAEELTKKYEPQKTQELATGKAEPAAEHKEPFWRKKSAEQVQPAAAKQEPQAQAVEPERPAVAAEAPKLGGMERLTPEQRTLFTAIDAEATKKALGAFRDRDGNIDPERLDFRNSKGESALFHAGAAKTGALLEAGINIDATDKMGHNALWDASAPTSAILLRHGIDPNAREVGTEQTALYNAAHDPKKTAEILRARPDALWPDMAKNQSPHDMLEWGKTFRQQDERDAEQKVGGFNGRPQDQKELRDADGRGPLVYADARTAKILMAYGASPEMEDKNHKKPTEHARDGFNDNAFGQEIMVDKPVMKPDPAKAKVMESPKQYRTAEFRRSREGRGQGDDGHGGFGREIPLPRKPGD